MRISDNPALTSATLSGSDVMLLTDVDDLTNGKPKDKRLTFNSLAAWIFNAAIVSFDTSKYANGGSRVPADLLGTTIINTSTDMNTITNPGKYYIYTPTGETMTNLPSGVSNGWLEVYKSSGAVVKQFLHRHGSQPSTWKAEYFRIYSPVDNVATWSDWERIATYTSLESYVPTTRTVNGHALDQNVNVLPSDLGISNVTAIAMKASDAIPLTNSTNTEILDSGSLSTGKYLLVGGGMFNGTTTTANGVGLGFSTTSGGNMINQSHVSQRFYGQTWVQSSLLVNVDSATTYHLIAWQNSGGDINFKNGYINLIKLRNA